MNTQLKIRVSDHIENNFLKLKTTSATTQNKFPRFFFLQHKSLGLKKNNQTVRVIIRRGVETRPWVSAEEGVYISNEQKKHQYKK